MEVWSILLLDISIPCLHLVIEGDQGRSALFLPRLSIVLLLELQAPKTIFVSLNFKVQK